MARWLAMRKPAVIWFEAPDGSTSLRTAISVASVALRGAHRLARLRSLRPYCVLGSGKDVTCCQPEPFIGYRLTLGVYCTLFCTPCSQWRNHSSLRFGGSVAGPLVMW